MRKPILILLTLFLLLSWSYQVPITHSQEVPQFERGDKVLIETTLDVYTFPTTQSTLVTQLPVGLRVQISRYPVEAEGRIWYYISNQAYGWVSQEIDTVETIFNLYTEEAERQWMADLTEQIAEDSDDFEARRVRSMLYYNQREYDNALVDLIHNTTHQTNPNIEDLGWLGKVYMDKSNRESIEEGIDIFTDLLEQKPDDMMIVIRLGILHERLNEIPQARRLLEGAYEQVDDYPLLVNNLGTYYWFSGDREKFLDHIEIALELDAEFSPAYLNFGFNYYNNNFNLAWENFTNAIEADPYNGDNYAARADLAFDYGLQEEAEIDYEKALDLSPYSSNVRLSVGGYYLHIGEYHTAIDHYLIGIDINEMDSNLHLNLGITYGRISEYKKALEQFDILLELGSRFVYLYYYRGIMYIELGQYPEAREALQIYLNRNSNFDARANAICYLLIGRTYLENGNYQLSIESFEDAFQADYDTALYYNYYGSDYRYITPVLQDDVHRLELEIFKDDSNPDLYFELGKAQLLAGLWVEAITSFRTYIELGEDIPVQFEDYVDQLEAIVVP